MFLSSSIVRQFIVSSVLLSVFQCSSAVRFSRSMRYPAPSMKKYIKSPRYIPFTGLPRSMQRRFMWREMDDSVDELMSGVRTMTEMFSPPMVRYRKPIEYDTQSSAKVKYVIKKPQPPPFKQMQFMKFRAPKKTFPIYNAPVKDIPAAVPAIPSAKPNSFIPFMSEQELRQIEKEQEQRVEGELNNGVHEHSHQTHMDADLFSGRINEFGQGWLPVQSHYSTPKAFPVSQLHTKVEVTTTTPPVSAPLTRSDPKDIHSYEVTEHSAEESVQREQAFKPSNHFNFFGATTEQPNYPEYFLKNIQKNEEQLKPIRVHPPVTTSTAYAPTTTSSITSTTLSHRLPSRSTTERPFTRYSLHRPKSSKLFFNRPTSSSDSTRIIRTTTITTTEKSITPIPELLPLIQEPIKTTRETIKTRRESLRSTKEPPKVAPQENVRTPRNDLKVKSKIRIKNATKNESLNEVLNKHRGMVKFGEKS